MLDAEGNCLNGARHFGAPQLETALISAFRHRSRLVPGRLIVRADVESLRPSQAPIPGLSRD